MRKHNRLIPLFGLGLALALGLAGCQAELPATDAPSSVEISASVPSGTGAGTGLIRRAIGHAIRTAARLGRSAETGPEPVAEPVGEPDGAAPAPVEGPPPPVETAGQEGPDVQTEAPARPPIPDCEAVAAEIRSRPSMAGRFVVPAAGIDVAVFNSLDQSVCDAADSAAMGPNAGNTLLADHNTQAFKRLTDCVAGVKAYLVTDTGVHTYESAGAMSGRNAVTHLESGGGEPIPIIDGLVAYTCKEHWTHVTIVNFVHLSFEPAVVSEA